MNEAHLLETLKNKPTHSPRTRYWEAAGQPKYTNELILSDSPYLLQHAHNPIDWRGWSEEAFLDAQRLDRPVFLSIGYSTCHWCHVMERESFEDETLAQFMNEHFIAIKVDREERPEIDALYMDFLQITTGEGGWPMNLFLTPTKRPIFAATYLPPRDGDRGVKVGLLSYLKVMQKSWRDPRLLAQGDAPLRVLREYALQPPVSQLSADWIDTAAQEWMKDFDEDWGGFSAPPKFVRPAMLEALLRAWHRDGDSRYLQAVEVTLERLSCGGIYDHIGGGVSRYSVDNRWWLPHFEKMLYDNAQLISVSLEVYQITKRKLYAELARDCLSFIERELQVETGAWAAAIDAESLTDRGELVEGHYYTWTYQELTQLFTTEELEWLTATFGLSDHGNIFEAQASESEETNNAAEVNDGQVGERPTEGESHQAPQYITKGLDGRNLFRVYEPLDEEEQRYWRPLRDKLYQARMQRPQPARDEQVICSWNAMMLSALSRAASVLADPHYLNLAKSTAEFLTQRMWDGARVKRVWRHQGDEAQQTDGVLEDYMSLSLGLIDYFEASGEVSALHYAIEIYEAAEVFFDQERGGFFRVDLNRRRSLPYEEKPLIDGAEPSGNALAALAALKLHLLTDIPHYRAQADSTLKAIGSIMSAQPTATPKALCALAHWFGSRGQVISIQLRRSDDRISHPLAIASWQQFQPFTMRLTLTHIDSQLKSHLPLLSKRPTEVDEPHALICSSRGCTPPITQVSALRSAISQLDA